MKQEKQKGIKGREKERRVRRAKTMVWQLNDGHRNEHQEEKKTKKRQRSFLSPFFWETEMFS